jgi:ABC-type proline/glycine betaine transport system permease subunit
MESKFLAANRGLLRLCAGVARFCGLFALLGTAVLIAVMIAVTTSDTRSLDAVAESRAQLQATIPHIVFYGFVALMLAEFISYLLAEQGEPKWILRHGDKIIFAYVVYATVMSVIAVAGVRGVEREISPLMPPHAHLYLAFGIVSIVVRTLIWIGIAIVLRKVVPIIRESKTLV